MDDFATSQRLLPRGTQRLSLILLECLDETYQTVPMRAEYMYDTPDADDSDGNDNDDDVDDDGVVYDPVPANADKKSKRTVDMRNASRRHRWRKKRETEWIMRRLTQLPPDIALMSAFSAALARRGLLPPRK